MKIIQLDCNYSERRVPFSRPCTYTFRKSSSLCGLITEIQLKFRQNRIKRDEKQRFGVFLDSFLSTRVLASYSLSGITMNDESQYVPPSHRHPLHSLVRGWEIRNSTNVFGRCDLCNGMSIEHDLRCTKFRRKKHFLTLRKRL